MNHGFAQIPCRQCGTTVWISPQVGFGVCPSCHQQNQLGPGQAAGPAGAQQPGQPGGYPQPGGYAQPGAAQPGQPGGYPQPGGYAQPGAAQPGMPAMPQMAFPQAGGAGGFGMARIFGGAVLAIVVAGGGIGYGLFKDRFIPQKGKATYGALGLDAKRPDADTMISSVASYAKKWKKDAYWWEVNLQAVRADGTVDVSKGASVEYISPSGVQKKSKKLREDSIKKFVFGPNNVDYSKQWNALNEWKGVSEPAEPDCSIKDLMKVVAKEAKMGDDDTVRVSFDPQFDWRDQQLWHVIGDSPKIDARYSMKDCAKVTVDGKAGGRGESDDPGEE